MEDFSKIAEHLRALEDMGCSVVIFTQEELRGANPHHVASRLIELGWEVIDDIAGPDDESNPTEEEWNWSIK
jgi:hypothetical protein